MGNQLIKLYIFLFFKNHIYKMSTFEIILLILQIVNIIFSLCITPIITGVIEFSKRIEKSSCFGSSVELTKINELKKEIEKVHSKIDLANQI